MRFARLALAGFLALGCAGSASAQNFQSAISGVKPSDITFKQVDTGSTIAGPSQLDASRAIVFQPFLVYPPSRRARPDQVRRQPYSGASVQQCVYAADAYQFDCGNTAIGHSVSRDEGLTQRRLCQQKTLRCANLRVGANNFEPLTGANPYSVRLDILYF